MVEQRNDGLTLLEYWMILYKRRYSIVLIVFVSTLTAVLISKYVAPVYEASAAFYVPVEPPEVAFLSPSTMQGIATDMTKPLQDEDLYKPYIGILKSRRLAEYVHAQYPEKPLKKLLRSDMDFEVTDEFLVRVYGRDEDPKLAADITNAYVRNLNRILEESSHFQLQEDPKVLEAAIERVRGQLAAAREALRDFEESHNMAAVDQQIAEATSQRTALQNQIAEIAVTLEANEQKVRELAAQLELEEGIVATNDAALSNPLIEHLRLRLAELSTEIIEKTVELGKNHGDVVVLRSKQEALEEQLHAELSKLIEGKLKPDNLFYEDLREEMVNLVVEKNRLQGSGRAYKSVLEQTNERIRELPRIRSQWAELENEVDRFEELYGQILLSLNELQLQEMRPLRLVVTVDEAGVPDTPAFPILPLNVFVSLIAGVIAGVLYALFLNYLEASRRMRMRRVAREIVGE